MCTRLNGPSLKTIRNQLRVSTVADHHSAPWPGRVCTRRYGASSRMSTTVLIVDDSPTDSSFAAIIVRATRRLGGLRQRKARKWGDCCRTGESSESGYRDHGLVDAGHEWMQAASRKSPPLPQNSYGPVHHARHRILLKDAQRAGIKDVVSKLDGPARLMASSSKARSEARPPEGMTVGRDPLPQ